MVRVACLTMAIVGCDGAALAQPAGEETSAASRPAESAPTGEKPAVQSIIQTLPDYTGDLAHRQYLTGDWGGARTKLAKKGILFDLDLTQLLQGIGVFGGFGFGGEPNIFEQFYSIGLSGKGSLPERDRDMWGVGCYHANMNDNINPAFGLHSEQGVEL